MQSHNIFRILGILLIAFSVTLLPPIAVSLWFTESTQLTFAWSALAILLLGIACWIPHRNQIYEIRNKEAFLIVVLFWVTLCLMGAIPFCASQNPQLSFIEALFESISGLTATGATMLTNLDNLPHSILYYRQQLQFVGGGGIILLGVAILPMLSVGGMQLFRAEMGGPNKEEKLMPKIAQSAKALWGIYIGLTFLCVLSYYGAGMELFDAICHSFSTVSTGGFSTHDESIGYFDSEAIEMVALIFMFLGSINFSLHFTAFQHKNLSYFWKDAEFKTYVIFLLVLSAFVSLALLHYDLAADITSSFFEGFFHVMSFSTTTGLSSVYYDDFPIFLMVLLMFISLIGGCAGSSTGGIKMIRAILINKQCLCEINRLIHPNAHYIIKVGTNPIHTRTLEAVSGFLAAYIIIFIFLLLSLLATGLDFMVAFSGLLTVLSGTGLGFGLVHHDFHTVNDAAKMLFSFAMLIGRLEFFTVLILCTPVYWNS